MRLLVIPDRIAASMKTAPEEYRERAWRDYETMAKWLPPGVRSILDIGCGLAGVDVFLAVATGATDINLMDGDGTAPRKMGFVDGTKAWSNVRDGAELFRANLPGVRVSCRKLDAVNVPCDLLISLKSWAHHYPASTYMGLAVKSLRKGGRIIVDIRTGTDGLKDFEAAGFAPLGVCHETVKAKRYVLAHA